jgi:DoxX-like protein
MKTHKIIYWSATALLSAILLFSAGMYILKNEMIHQAFTNFGYPTYLIYPLVFIKIAAVIILLTPNKSFIKSLVYAGLFFEFILAFFAHIMVKDGELFTALLAFVFLITSYVFGEKLTDQKIK